MNENDKPIILPDGSKIKQFAVAQGGDDRPFYSFLSEKGNMYVACYQGWPNIEPLNLMRLSENDLPKEGRE